MLFPTSCYWHLDQCNKNSYPTLRICIPGSFQTVLLWFDLLFTITLYQQLFCCYDKHHDQQHVLLPLKGAEARNVVESWGQRQKQRPWRNLDLLCSPWFVHSASTIQRYWSSGNLTHRLDLPTSIINKIKMLQRLSNIPLW